eukprot:TRINITY_DN47607_c0_g1_i1.p1 TRINITY_DN47607_c0_g1~~TRINITY_DN47607_c0_g1_i1.p1  ORF type:complete len:447 (+),score=237.17 TRINITY_DN47607_c0_g1_i1:191-1342(+)
MHHWLVDGSLGKSSAELATLGGISTVGSDGGPGGAGSSIGVDRSTVRQMGLLQRSSSSGSRRSKRGLFKYKRARATQDLTIDVWALPLASVCDRSGQRSSRTFTGYLPPERESQHRKQSIEELDRLSINLALMLGWILLRSHNSGWRRNTTMRVLTITEKRDDVGEAEAKVRRMLAAARISCDTVIALSLEDAFENGNRDNDAIISMSEGANSTFDPARASAMSTLSDDVKDDSDASGDGGRPSSVFAQYNRVIRRYSPPTHTALSIVPMPRPPSSLHVSGDGSAHDSGYSAPTTPLSTTSSSRASTKFMYDRDMRRANSINVQNPAYHEQDYDDNARSANSSRHDPFEANKYAYYEDLSALSADCGPMLLAHAVDQVVVSEI